MHIKIITVRIKLTGKKEMGRKYIAKISWVPSIKITIHNINYLWPRKQVLRHVNTNRCFKKGAAASTKPTSIVLGKNIRKKSLENRLSLPSTVRSSSCTYYDLGSIGRVFHPSSCIFFHSYYHCCVKRNKIAWTHLHSNIKHKGVDQWYIMPGTSPNSIAWWKQQFLLQLS